MRREEHAETSHPAPDSSRSMYFLWLIWIAWLPFVVPALVEVIQAHPSPLQTVASLLGLTLFVATYLWITWHNARDLTLPAPPVEPTGVALWSAIAILVALSVALTVTNGWAWGATFIFTSAGAAGRLPARQAVGAVVALDLLIVVGGWLRHADFATIAQAVVFVSVVGFVVMTLVRSFTTTRELQAAREEIARLARERVEQELSTARRIQQSLLPKAVPTLEGWQIATYYQPARAVGGDFYDFLPLADGRLGIVLGDVTDKGVPAALVMATTRSMLRAAAQGEASPGQVLARVNELLYADLPPAMFVTCFYAVLDPTSGRLRYANAGQDLPYRRRADGGICELRARGMPLGLMAGMVYEEQEAELAGGDSVLFYSDGLVEAHNPQRELFGFPRLAGLLAQEPAGEAGDAKTIERLLGELAAFTGAGWEQEDDVTLVTLRRTGESGALTGEDAHS
jgi:serine phosphatase RsbU (regulator of sigma subunit)